MGKVKKEKEYSIALAERTKAMVREAFEGKICEKCGDPAERVLSAKFLCHKCAPASNDPAQTRAIPLPRRWQDQKSWQSIGKD